MSTWLQATYSRNQRKVVTKTGSADWPFNRRSVFSNSSSSSQNESAVSQEKKEDEHKIKDSEAKLLRHGAKGRPQRKVNHAVYKELNSDSSGNSGNFRLDRCCKHKKQTKKEIIPFSCEEKVEAHTKKNVLRKAQAKKHDTTTTKSKKSSLSPFPGMNFSQFDDYSLLVSDSVETKNNFRHFIQSSPEVPDSPVLLTKKSCETIDTSTPNMRPLRSRGFIRDAPPLNISEISSLEDSLFKSDVAADLPNYVSQLSISPANASPAVSVKKQNVLPRNLQRNSSYIHHSTLNSIAEIEQSGDLFSDCEIVTCVTCKKNAIYDEVYVECDDCRQADKLLRNNRVQVSRDIHDNSLARSQQSSVYVDKFVSLDSVDDVKYQSCKSNLSHGKEAADCQFPVNDIAQFEINSSLVSPVSVHSDDSCVNCTKDTKYALNAELSKSVRTSNISQGDADVNCVMDLSLSNDSSSNSTQSDNLQRCESSAEFAQDPCVSLDKDKAKPCAMRAEPCSEGDTSESAESECDEVEEECDLEEETSRCDVTGGNACKQLVQNLKRKSLGRLSMSITMNNLSLDENILSPIKTVEVDAISRVLELCGQEGYLSFKEFIPLSKMKKCVKIGEGVYGEVFRTQSNKCNVAIKIIPIEGELLVNGEKQKTFDEIIPEIYITQQLHKLRESSRNSTECFAYVKRVACIQGAYPQHLLKEWDIFAKEKDSENDRPDQFPDDQLFIAFEFLDAGCDLASFKFTNINEAKSVLQQVTVALAVAELQLQFEHRDLHWGNVLVQRTSEEFGHYTLHDNVFKYELYGIKVTVIDFTLSRLSKDECTVFCDLSTDDTLFSGHGDYQFEIYRLMKEANGNLWELYNPYTNVLWLHYICDKLIKETKYKTNGRSHQKIMRSMRALNNNLLDNFSATDILLNNEF